MGLESLVVVNKLKRLTPAQRRVEFHRYARILGETLAHVPPEWQDEALEELLGAIPLASLARAIAIAQGVRQGRVPAKAAHRDPPGGFLNLRVGG